MFIVAANKNIPQPQRGEMTGECRGLSRQNRPNHCAPLGLGIFSLPLLYKHGVPPGLTDTTFLSSRECSKTDLRPNRIRNRTATTRCLFLIVIFFLIPMLSDQPGTFRL